MRIALLTVTLLLLIILPRPAAAAPCFVGTWLAETKTATHTLIIKDDGCFDLTTVSKGNDPDIRHDTCYKLKSRHGQSYRLTIDDNHTPSTAKVTCSGKQLKLTWGEFKGTVFKRAF